VLPMKTVYLRAAAAVLLLNMAASAFAVLGEASLAPLANRSMSASTGQILHAGRPAGSDGTYQVHEFQLGSGTMVKEIATAQGTVFAVTWRGPVLPDLTAFLGVYFTTFNQAAAQARAGGARASAVSVNKDGLVLRSSGRMRAFEGYAFATSLVPTGVNIDELLQ
jgi:hypothetical protein